MIAIKPGQLYRTDDGTTYYAVITRHGRLRLMDKNTQLHDLDTIGEQLQNAYPPAVQTDINPSAPPTDDGKPRCGDIWLDRHGDVWFIGDDDGGDLAAVCWGDITQVSTWRDAQKFGPIRLAWREEGGQ